MNTPAKKTLLRPLHVDSCGSDRPRRLPARLEASASGPAASRAHAASPQAAWRSGVGGGGFHVNRCRHASPPPLHVDSCGSDRPRRLPARLEASASGPAASRAHAASPQAAWRSGVGGGGFRVNAGCSHSLFQEYITFCPMIGHSSDRGRVVKADILCSFGGGRRGFDPRQL